MPKIPCISRLFTIFEAIIKAVKIQQTGKGNNLMVGATVACAVAVEEACK